MVGGDHDHHAEQREHGQHEGFSAEQSTRGKVAARVDEHQHHREAGQEVEQVAEGVGHEHVAEGAYGRLVKYVQGRRCGRRNAESSVSQYETWRRGSGTNKSIISTAHAMTSNTISGSAGT